jgi:hypothetical protein
MIRREAVTASSARATGRRVRYKLRHVPDHLNRFGGGYPEQARCRIERRLCGIRG